MTFMAINEKRLAEVFVQLCETDSPSFKEAEVADLIKNIFSELYPDAFYEDDSASTTGSDSGNLIFRFNGSNPGAEPVFFNAHMDTVTPGMGVKVKRQDRIFSSVGDTVLGGDDKSGIAILIEAMRAIKEDNLTHGPVEFVFTTCEENGLLGAKAFDHKSLRAKMGFALDMDVTDQIITKAPAANRFIAEFKGLSAHAGLNPEQGINSIQLAAKAMADLKIGRLDAESTSNIGVIHGGAATNIVPELTRVEGEVRSHSEEKLARYTQTIEEAFHQAVDTWTDPTGHATGKPSLKFSVSREYPAMKLHNNSAVIKRVEKAASNLGRNITHIATGGGSDANIFNGYGLETTIIGTGMQKVHTTEEYIDLADMVRTTELIKSILTTA